MTFREVIRKIDAFDVFAEEKQAYARICKLPRNPRTRAALAHMIALAAADMERAEISSRGAWRRWTEVS